MLGAHQTAQAQMFLNGVGSGLHQPQRVLVEIIRADGQIDRAQKAPGTVVDGRGRAAQIVQRGIEML